jgi:hypothetical protein
VIDQKGLIYIHSLERNKKGRYRKNKAIPKLFYSRFVKSFTTLPTSYI